MNIVLFGLQNAGKTTIGKKLAAKLNKAFIDTDHLLEKTYQISRQKKLTTRQIYQEVGPFTFRALEYEVIQSLQDVQNSIIAVGGGAMLLYDNVEALKKTSHLVYLFFEKEPLKKRVLAQDPLPTFLDPNNLDASFDQMYDERNDHYKKIGALEIDVTTLKDDTVIEKICNQIKDGKQ